MLIKVVSGPVVTSGGPWVGVSGGVLNVTEAGSRVKTQSHEGVSEVVGMETPCLGGYGFASKSP